MILLTGGLHREAVSPQSLPLLAAPREWETILRGSWVNKIGVFVQGIGLAPPLRYSFTQYATAVVGVGRAWLFTST
jgi:hypothetical protein